MNKSLKQLTEELHSPFAGYFDLHIEAMANFRDSSFTDAYEQEREFNEDYAFANPEA